MVADTEESARRNPDTLTGLLNSRFTRLRKIVVRNDSQLQRGVKNMWEAVNCCRFLEGIKVLRKSRPSKMQELKPYLNFG